MGKAQSKRSVDITTENKKGPEEEVTGKLEKIEDIDQKQVNGDATPPENVEGGVPEKKEADESEHDKDLTTEKSAAEATKAGGDNAGDQNNTTTAASASTAADAPKEDAAAAVVVAETKEGAVEDISPLADESMKKTKKEKVKSKWSFRKISFGKKDKQKPPKTEETAEAAAATNGEAEKPAEGVAESAQKDAAGGDAAAVVETKPAEKLENGNATEKELNGQKTPTPTEEKPADIVANVANTTAAVATAAAAASVSVPAAPSTTNETANEIQTESKVAVSGESVEASAAAVVAAAAAADIAIVSNGTDIAAAAVAAEKNGIIENVAPVVNNEIANEAAVKEVSAVIENIKSIPSDVVVVEKLHQNGMNSDELETDAEQSKSQIEVKTHTESNSAANLASTHPTTTITLPPPFDPENAIETANKTAAIDAVVVVSSSPCVEECGVSAHCDSLSEPPPLPISPPPSQMSVFAFNAENAETGSIPTTVAVQSLALGEQPEINETVLSPEEAGKPKVQKDNSDRTVAADKNLEHAHQSPSEMLDAPSAINVGTTQPSAELHEEYEGEVIIISGISPAEFVELYETEEVKLPAEGSKSEVEIATIEETILQLAEHAEQLMETGDNPCDDSEEYKEMRAQIAGINFKELSPAQRKLFLKLLREESDLELFLTGQALEMLTELDEDDNFGHLDKNIEEVCNRVIEEMKQNAPKYLAEQFIGNIIEIIQTVNRLAEDGAEKKQQVQEEQLVEADEREVTKTDEDEQTVKPFEQEIEQQQQKENEIKAQEDQAESKTDKVEEGEEHKTTQIEKEATNEADDTVAAFIGTNDVIPSDETDKNEIAELHTESDKNNVDLVASIASLSIDAAAAATPPPSIDDGLILDYKPSIGDACFSSSSLNAPIITETLVPLNDCDVDVNPN